MENQIKQFKGKAIYNPTGKAAEYAKWACNFYTGCSNACEYCYCRKGVMAHTWSEVPKLKKCFEGTDHALGIFEKELVLNKTELQKHGLFFSFTTDPMLIDTILLTQLAIRICLINDVPVTVLTKRTDWVRAFLKEIQDNGTIWNYEPKKHLITIGFTLTGCDDLEPFANSNFNRIDSMIWLHNEGFKTIASIEPIVDFESSIDMIRYSARYCDLFKIGLMSGMKVDEKELRIFVAKVKTILCFFPSVKVYWKDSITKVVGNDIVRSENSVTRDYNLFEQLQPELS